MHPELKKLFQNNYSNYTDLDFDNIYDEIRNKYTSDQKYGVIYGISNQITGQQYIGQTKHWKSRPDKHLKGTKGNSGARKLLLAVDKYGAENFQIHFIDTASSLEELNELEQFYIGFYCTKSIDGYNLDSGGTLYKEVSKETRMKHAENNKKNGNGKRLGSYFKRHPEKKDAWLTNVRKWSSSEECSRIRSENARGKNNPMYGKIHPSKGRPRKTRGKPNFILRVRNENVRSSSTHKDLLNRLGDCGFVDWSKEI